MGLYYRKRIKLLPGVRLNLSKSGASLSVGRRGASMNFGKRGTYMNAGIPGTGIYSRTRISQSSKQPPIKEYNTWTDSKQWGCAMLLLFTFFSTVFLLSGNFDWSLGAFLIGFLLYFFITRRKSKNLEVADNDEIPAIPSPSSKEQMSDVSEIQSADVVPSNAAPEIDEDSKGHIIDWIAKRMPSVDEGYDMTLPDPILKDVALFIVANQCGSITLIQRKFSIGYNRAGRIMDQLECAGIVGGATGSKPREVLCKNKNDLLKVLSGLNESQFENLFCLEKEEEFRKHETMQESSRLIKMGMELEKEGMIDEAIKVYEKSIIPQIPVKYPYERLVVLYRKRKDYTNEIRVIENAIKVFMKENERRAERAIENDSKLYDEVMQALETNESIRYDDGKWAFVQYDVMDWISRYEKAKNLQNNQNRKQSIVKAASSTRCQVRHKG